MLTIPKLTDLPTTPFINADGKLPHEFDHQIGAFAIFDQDNQLMHLGFSRNVLLSLKQSLVRRPETCYSLKVATIERPSKRQLQDILTQWQTESGGSPYSDHNPEENWTDSINLHTHMTAEEQASFTGTALDDRGKVKLLKQVSRRLEAHILEVLAQRGYQDEMRFNPKLKEIGRLDVKE